MKSFGPVLLSFALLVCALVAPDAAAAKPEAPGSAIRGEVLDLACWVTKGVKGADHAACAKKCVKAGQPMGLLTPDGTVYLLLADHADAAPYDKAKEFAGRSVEVSGPVSSKAGMKGITVEAVRPI